MTSSDEKPATQQPEPEHEEVGKISEENLQAVAMDIDRQMKKLAEMDTRVLMAKEQLAEFQEMIQTKIGAFQKKSADERKEGHSDIMKSIRETKDEAAKFIKESKAINEAYEVLVNRLEKGKEAAIRETRKAEIVFKEKFHEVEEKLRKKTSEIKENIKHKK